MKIFFALITLFLTQRSYAFDNKRMLTCLGGFDGEISIELFASASNGKGVIDEDFAIILKRDRGQIKSAYVLPLVSESFSLTMFPDGSAEFKDRKNNIDYGKCVMGSQVNLLNAKP